MNNDSKILVGLILSLLIIGMVMVFTASGTYSALKFDSLYSLFNSHLVKVLLGIAALIIGAIIPYQYYKKYSKIGIFVIVILLLITFILGAKMKGASRWLSLSFFTIQPSELAKLILITHLSFMIEKKNELIKDFKKGLVFPLFWIGLITSLVLAQPNVSTSIIIVLISLTMLYIGGARFKHLFFTFGGLAIVGSGIIMLFDHSRKRVLTYINALLNDVDINLQVKQAKIGLGSGGISGIGLGESKQSDLFLPESYGDFIFSVIGEELGLLGTVGVLLIYLAIFYIGLQIAKNAKDEFAKLLVFGLSFNIVISAFINASVVVGLLPTTGITLPLISYGGTSIILNCLAAGIIVNIARYNKPSLNEPPVEIKRNNFYDS